jgi:outer membrane lipoprotein LolB
MTPSGNRYAHIGRYISLLTLSLLLGACSHYSTKQETDFGLDRKTYVDIPDTWAIHAKLGIKNGEDSGSVTLHWRQEGDEYTIQLSGPFGQGNAKLSGNSRAIRIARPGKEPLYSGDPTALVQQTFGWDLPLQHLPYWIRGEQSPLGTRADDQGHQHTTATIQYNEIGLLSALSQLDWALEYSRYKPQQQRLAPHKIRAKSNGVTLTLLIKEWDFMLEGVPEAIGNTNNATTRTTTDTVPDTPTTQPTIQ